MAGVGAIGTDILLSGRAGQKVASLDENSRAISSCSSDNARVFECFAKVLGPQGFLVLSILDRSSWLMIVGVVLFALVEIVDLLQVRAREKKTFEARLLFTVSIWITGAFAVGIIL